MDCQYSISFMASCNKHKIMDSDSSNPEPTPKRLKSVASEVKYPNKNNLLHQFVIDNSDPNNSVSQNCINAVLLAMNDSGIDVNALNGDGCSPLHLAVLKNNLLMVKKLLSCLANIDVNAKCGDENEETVSKRKSLLFSSKGRIDRKTLQIVHNKGKTALYLAVQSGEIPIIQELLNKDADVNMKVSAWLHDTALLFAVQFCSLDIVKLLISKGANADVINGERGYLHFAAGEGNIEVAKFLISKGADVNVKDHGGSTPLYFAVRKGNLATVEFLVSNGADINVKDHGGSTPLHDAARSHNLATVQFLVNNGADVNAKDERGRTPLYCAERASDLHIIEFLQDIIKTAALNSRLERFRSYKNFSKQMIMK